MSSLLNGCVAQSVEHLTFNQRVSGSNPDALTNKIKGLRVFSNPFLISYSIADVKKRIFIIAKSTKQDNIQKRLYYIMENAYEYGKKTEGLGILGGL